VVFVIQSTSNRGFSAAKFLLAPQTESRNSSPPPAIRGLGGVWGGGARFLHVCG